MATLKANTLAYLDCVIAGLVPCKVVRVRRFRGQVFPRVLPFDVEITQ